MIGSYRRNVEVYRLSLTNLKTKNLQTCSIYKSLANRYNKSISNSHSASASSILTQRTMKKAYACVYSINKF